MPKFAKSISKINFFGYVDISVSIWFWKLGSKNGAQADNFIIKFAQNNLHIHGSAKYVFKCGTINYT